MTIGVHLKHFLCALQWTRTGILEFNKLILLLTRVMGTVLKNGKRIKRAVASLCQQSVGWSEVLTTTFQCCKNALNHQMQLSHENREKLLCIFTDAWHRTRPEIVTQISR